MEEAKLLRKFLDGKDLSLDYEELLEGLLEFSDENPEARPGKIYATAALVKSESGNSSLCCYSGIRSEREVALEEFIAAPEWWGSFEPMGVELKVAELTLPDPRETTHMECDCVPNLGPSHCHLCGESVGAPVPWQSCRGRK